MRTDRHIRAKRWQVLCDPFRMNRYLPLLLCSLLAAPALCQERAPTINSGTDSKNSRLNHPERATRPQGSAPMAGNPSTRPGGYMAVPDTAFAYILLDRSQAARIEDMNERYADELRQVGTIDPTNTAYRDLWQRRRAEVQAILTPVQFERWEELNAGHLDAGLVIPEPVRDDRAK